MGWLVSLSLLNAPFVVWINDRINYVTNNKVDGTLWSIAP